jgi:hypothetical protein
MSGVHLVGSSKEECEGPIGIRSRRAHPQRNPQFLLNSGTYWRGPSQNITCGQLCIHTQVHTCTSIYKRMSKMEKK